MSKPFGFLSINKPTGLTSHDCVNVIRKLFGTRRVGHGGTLDPSVTGVLPIAIGNATRLLPYLQEGKRYKAKIQLGVSTSTDDLNGEIFFRRKWPVLEKVVMEKYLNKFRGAIQQQPPRVSSIHIKGERAYKKARRGELFDLPTKKIFIYKLILISWDNNSGLIEIDVHCSSGTYIRSIARDLGESLGCGGCLKELHRTQALGFTEDQSILLPRNNNNKTSILPNLIPPIEALLHLDQIKLREEQLDLWRKGQRLILLDDYPTKIANQKECLPKNQHLNKFIAIVNCNNKVEGIGEKIEQGTIQPKVVFNAYG
tara:strand:+ start:24258 stop:25196 length:939 start_codon:yes stop_codon:yes gene_type:complete